MTVWVPAGASLWSNQEGSALATSAYGHSWVEFTSFVEIYKTSDLGTMIDSDRPFDLSVDTGGAFGRFELEDHVGYTYTNNTGVSGTVAVCV